MAQLLSPLWWSSPPLSSSSLSSLSSPVAIVVVFVSRCASLPVALSPSTSF
jgi:hypothetical protein